MAVIVLYPCSQFDYITSGRNESESQELLETWIAAHHPVLLELDATMPRWETSSYPPFNLQKENDIVIIPPCCETYWNDDWEQQTAGCTLIRNDDHRDEIVQQVFTARSHEAQPFDENFVADCYAFAVARFLLALMNRNLHYMHMPDDIRLKELLGNAINAARHNEPGGVQQALQSAFDEIASAKDHYHQTQNYFVELVLVTKTTTGEALRQLLFESPQIDLFMPSSVLETLPETQPETFAQLQTAVEQRKVRFIVDDTEPQSLTLLPILDVADRILAGLSAYSELLKVSPTIYGRLTNGLSPALPQLLKLTEIKGAIHFAPLVGWHIPEQEQSKIVWQGVDNTSADTLVRYPVDASTYLAFFKFAEHFSSQHYQDSVPTAVFALFPGQQSGWLGILRQMNRYTTAFGKFVNIEEYFDQTGYTGGSQRFGYDKYPVNALMEPEQNPISQWNGLYRESRDRLVQSALETLLTLLNRPVSELPVAQQLTEAITCREPATGASGQIAINPLSFARRMFIDDVAVDVPPLGYAFHPSGDTPIPDTVVPAKTGRLKGLLSFVSTKDKPAPVLARQSTDDIGRGEKRSLYILENRYFTAKFDATTGILRSIFTNRSRHNQLSQQIACRKNQKYTVQCVDEITITKSTTEVGQLRIAGRLVFPEGELAARFIETATIRSQSRLLEIDLTLEPIMELDDDRWNSYIAVRYAWNDDGLIQRGYLNDGMHILPDRKHLHSPKLVDLRSEVESLTFFTEGLPFHRRSGNRQLDTLAVVKGETQRQFRLGIGVNMKNPVFASHDFLLGQEGFVFPVQCQPKNPSSWLFQIESSNVVALHWEPIFEAGDKPVGYMVYLQEFEGRRAHFALRSFLPPKRAVAMNFQGKELKTLKTKGDAVLIDMHIYELLPLLVRFVEPTP